MSNNSDPQRPNPADLPSNSNGAAKKTAVRPAAASTPAPKSEAAVRDARLKAALKANMARRKGQARARAGGATPATAVETND